MHVVKLTIHFDSVLISTRLFTGYDRLRLFYSHNENASKIDGVYWKWREVGRFNM